MLYNKKRNKLENNPTLKLLCKVKPIFKNEIKILISSIPKTITKFRNKYSNISLFEFSDKKHE